MNHTNKDYMRGIPKACNIIKFIIYLLVCCLLLFFAIIPIADRVAQGNIDQSKNQIVETKPKEHFVRWDLNP